MDAAMLLPQMLQLLCDIDAAALVNLAAMFLFMDKTPKEIRRLIYLEFTMKLLKNNGQNCSLCRTR